MEFFGTNNKKIQQLGWLVGELDNLWNASVRYVSKFKSGFLLCTRITKTRTRAARGRNQCGFIIL
jgi:hypothetical protein